MVGGERLIRPDPPPFEIVESADEHVPAISSFFREAWRLAGPDAPGWAGADERIVAEIAEPNAIRARIGGPQQRMFLAVDGDQVLAFAATRLLDGSDAELAGIVVRQDAVGRGIGTPLLEAALDALAAEGVTRVVVRTEVDNERALAFYLSRGFAGDSVISEEVEGTIVEVVELERLIGPRA